MKKRSVIRDRHMGEDCESSRRVNFSRNQPLEETQNSFQRKDGFGLLAISESKRTQGNYMSEPVSFFLSLALERISVKSFNSVGLL